MILTLSPAKTLDYKTAFRDVPTRPRLEAEATTLATAAAKLSANRLRDLMHISEPLAKLNVDRFRAFADAPERPAIRAFAGDVYTGFEARSLDDDAIRYAQDHVRILSGLYGLLRPLDAMRPYRLEMGTRWAPGRPKDLYGWWKDRIADLLAADVAAEGSGLIVNLASQEYWRAVEGKLPADIRVLTIDFREDGPDGPRFVSFNAKRARGMMARWICEERIDSPQALEGFASDGYRFAGAEGDTLRFVRG